MSFRYTAKWFNYIYVYPFSFRFFSHIGYILWLLNFMVIPFYLFILLTFNFVLGCLGFPICLPMQDMSWDAYSIPVSERSPGGGNGNPLHSSCLDNPMDRTTWQGAIHEAVKSDTTKQLSMQGYLINNVVIISDDQQSDSVIHIHVLVPATHHPRQTPLPSRLPYDIEQNSLCSTVGPPGYPF